MARLHARQDHIGSGPIKHAFQAGERRSYTLRAEFMRKHPLVAKCAELLAAGPQIESPSHPNACASEADKSRVPVPRARRRRVTAREESSRRRSGRSCPLFLAQSALPWRWCATALPIRRQSFP
jgi:hypothetical protein